MLKGVRDGTVHFRPGRPDSDGDRGSNKRTGPGGNTQRPNRSGGNNSTRPTDEVEITRDMGKQPESKGK